MSYESKPKKYSREGRQLYKRLVGNPFGEFAEFNVPIDFNQKIFDVPTKVKFFDVPVKVKW